ncbi:MAG: GIY-YIG nuclease family protein [candidate division KSB1 bacterium]|nr:GIY-YIG nuclease family protein [candidate division KSB1 bacterium]
MFTVYALYSSKYDKIYIGYTSNLQARFKSHNKLATKGWTIKFRPWEILYTEEYLTKSEAMKREKQLKSYKGRQFIRHLINNRK